MTDLEQLLLDAHLGPEERITLRVCFLKLIEERDTLQGERKEVIYRNNILCEQTKGAYAELGAVKAEYTDLVNMYEKDTDKLRAELEQARAENRRLRESLEYTVELLQDSIDPGDFTAPEDIDVLRLCEFWGYGAVMNSAARLYRDKDKEGAFTVGDCIVIVKDVIAKARAALAGKDGKNERT